MMTIEQDYRDDLLQVMQYYTIAWWIFNRITTPSLTLYCWTVLAFIVSNHQFHTDVNNNENENKINYMGEILGE